MSLGTRETSHPRDDRRSDAGSGGEHSPRGEGSDPFTNLDPALHPETLNSASDSQNPLTDFAQHVLDGRDNELLGFGSDEQVLLAMGETRLDTLLEAAHKTERERQGLGRDDDHDEFHFSNDQPSEHLETAEAVAAVQPTEEDEHPPPPPPPLNNGRSHVVGRNKRRREGDDIVVGPVENGEPIDPIKMKKDSHKEVERRRRENINDGINEIARYIPGGMEKIGKGMLLRRAADYLAEITTKVARLDEELDSRERTKLDLEAQLAHTEALLQEERQRSMRFETSWREAEDRAANQQFEFERIKAELEDAKSQLADKS